MCTCITKLQVLTNVDFLRPKMIKLTSFLIIDLRKRFYTADKLDIYERIRFSAWHPHERVDLATLFKNGARKYCKLCLFEHDKITISHHSHFCPYCFDNRRSHDALKYSSLSSIKIRIIDYWIKVEIKVKWKRNTIITFPQISWLNKKKK